MATTHFRRVVYKAGGERLAAGRVAYITRTAGYAPAEARVRHQGLEAGTKRVREDLVEWKAANLPAWATDASHYFGMTETQEWARGVAYTEWRFHLPRELSHDQQMCAARDLLQASFGTQHPHIWALHRPLASDKGEQPHVHVLWSARTLDGIEREPAQFFQRYNAAHPERGGAQKAPWTYHMGAVKADRQLYTDVMNLHLEVAGHEGRLHPDKLRMRGFDRDREPSLKPSDSNAFKLHNAITPQMQKVLNHRLHYAIQHDAELKDAQQYWEARKQQLGITREMAVAQGLVRIKLARERAVTQAPARRHLQEFAERAEALEQAIRHEEATARIVRRSRQQFTRVPEHGQVKAGLRAHLFEREAEHARGAGYGV